MAVPLRWQTCCPIAQFGSWPLSASGWPRRSFRWHLDSRLETRWHRRTDFAIYEGNPSSDSEKGNDEDPAQKLAQTQNRLDLIVEAMEQAIANHEFEKARLYSDEERKERESGRLLREQFNLEEPRPQVPLLCAQAIREDRSDVQRCCDDYISEGVAQVWILDPNSKRAYTAIQTEGLREFKGEILRIANPPLEWDLKKILLSTAWLGDANQWQTPAKRAARIAHIGCCSGADSKLLIDCY